MPRQTQSAVFIDKDGTLVENVPYNVDCAQIHLDRWALPAVKLLHEAGYKIVVVTNQSGVARGMFPESALAAVEGTIRELLGDAGVPLAGFYYCPHHPEGVVGTYARRCACRKPQPGMFRRAASELGIELRSSWMIGDILDDVEAGHRAGCQAILIDNGGETLWQRSPLREPEHIVPDLLSAAGCILAETDCPSNEPLRSATHV